MATAPADMMPRYLFAALLGLFSLEAPAAEELEPLDADFLEYLAHLEGDDDDWTLMAATEEARTATEVVQPPPKDAKAETRESSSKPSRPADRPGADDK